MSKNYAIPLTILFALVTAILAVIAVVSGVLPGIRLLYLAVLLIGVAGLVLLLPVLLFRRICQPAFRLRLFLLLIGAFVAITLALVGGLVTITSTVLTQLLVGFAVGAGALTAASAFSVYLRLLDHTV